MPISLPNMTHGQGLKWVKVGLIFFCPNKSILAFAEWPILICIGNRETGVMIGIKNKQVEKERRGLDYTDRSYLL